MLRRILLFRRTGKAATIRTILELFPERKFVLIGDSGEKDPDIYARMARQFPHVAKVLIRDLPERPMTTQRRQPGFKRVSMDRWRVFREPAELADSIDEYAEPNRLVEA